MHHHVLVQVGHDHERPSEDQKYDQHAERERQPWDLLFVTQRGACDPTYNFSVNISNGVVTNPNLVRFTGHVARSGAVRASVTVQDKYASGSGQLSSNSGRATWSGYSGGARCSGYWAAQRN